MKRTLRMIFGAAAETNGDVGYRVASRDESLAASRRILERLDESPLVAREPVDPGVCDDCRRRVVGPRWRFGHVAVCRRCLLRREAGAKAITRPDGPDVGEHSGVVDDVARLASIPDRPKDAT